MARLPKSFCFVAAFHWVALLYIYGTSFFPPSCTRVGPVLAGLLFAPAEVLAYAFGYSSDSAFYIAAFIQCVAYVWLFWLMAPRQAGAQRRWS
jgi:hypothetical protein